MEAGKTKNLCVPESLHDQLKAKAKKDGRILQRMVEEILRRALKEGVRA